MEKFNLSEWLKDKSRKIVTRDGKPVMKPEEIELIQDKTDDFDWQSFRAEAAKDILCAVINREGSFTRNGQVVVSHQDFIEMAVEDADASIAKLKEKEEK